MTDTKPTLEDKLICHAPGDRCYGCDHYHGRSDVCKYAPELQSIPSAELPVEPDCVTKMRRLPNGVAYAVEREVLEYIDALTAYALKEKERADKYYELWREVGMALIESHTAEHREFERAEKAEADLKWAQEERDAKLEQLQIMETHLNLAESINRRMVELLKEPSEAMKGLGANELKWRGGVDVHMHVVELTFKAMSAELLKEVEK